MALEGERVRLREERLDDIPLLLALRNDMATQGWNQALPPDFTAAMERQRYEQREYSLDRSDGRFIIERTDTGEAVGLVRYSDLEPRWGVTLGIAMLRSAWGVQLAYDAQETLLRFVFLDLGVRVVRLWTHEANPRALRLAERSGFQVAVRARGCAYKDGRLFGVLLMDLLREEYFARHPELADELPPV